MALTSSRLFMLQLIHWHKARKQAAGIAEPADADGASYGGGVFSL